MMQWSSWSEAESGVAMGEGFVPFGDGGRGDGFRRCEVPEVEPVVCRFDQQVPVYRDQTVPEWHRPAGASSKRKMEHGSSGIGHGDLRRSRYVRASRGDDAVVEGTEKDCYGSYGRETNSGGATESFHPQVSFDDIMSMYQSSIMEKTSHTGSRALRAILKHRCRNRPVYRPWLWRRFARKLDSSASVGISVRLKSSRFGQRHVFGDAEESLLRSLQEAIERTSICDSSSNNSNMRLLPADHSVIQVRRCDLQDQLQRRCDPLTFATLMLTTSSS
ncbi:hypothetical protein M758_11G025700 [Ceratodon purpureus]|nr:hypothetical protein M758_11G025700 [Ceratodon purpureus]